jgi:hypothetical protein
LQHLPSVQTVAQHSLACEQLPALSVQHLPPPKAAPAQH